MRQANMGRADVKALPIPVLAISTYPLLPLFPITAILKYSFCVIIPK
jgi:hypothetical protein